MSRTLLLTATLVLVAACAAPAPQPEYQLGTGAPRQTRPEAEQALAARPVGAGLPSDIDTPPKVLFAHFPDYPSHLWARDVTGTVIVRFTVERDGTLTGARVRGTPPPALAGLALGAIAKWQFAPGRKGGEPVPMVVEQPFRFQLE